ncbi:hypothetical protein B9G69_000790 [Bdellovibrio sp. SKB1291214]|uniref:hypothetical protein n=1 Tax=Bdellovibrio sp. SKB1291214 TaxID=1732569 RepID=UPI000B51C36D|nr:hypothetical protein [Bdellovibrio sp. SKB1291214]UYL09111.1 hypothetical protein B9G69_000790 [Bdellovibrio sp. SKB1291214]
MKSILTLLVFISLLNYAQAEALSKNESDEILAKVERIRAALKQSASDSSSCTMPIPDACTFEGYCGKLASRGQSAYLYQDSEGHQIPNYAYLFLSEEIELCVQKSKPLIDDPFVYPKMFIDAKAAGGLENLNANKGRLEDAKVRLNKIVEDTRARLVGILQKRKNGSNDSQLDNMIERVKSVKFKAASPGSAQEMAENGCELPNAAYNLEKHEVVVCPQVLNMPEASLMGTLAHELGHSIDPCSSALDFAKDGAMYPDWMDVMANVKSGPVAFKGIKAKDNPFAGVISCLQTPSSINVQIPTKQKLISEINRQQDYLSKNASSGLGENQNGDEEDGGAAGRSLDATSARLDDQIDSLNAHYEDFKGCKEISQSILIDESFADWISSQVLADKVSALPANKANDFAFASAGILYSTACPDIASQAYAKATAAAPNCKSLQKFSDFGHGHVESSALPHPDPARRVNRIYYAKPEIKKALKCQGGETGISCE